MAEGGKMNSLPRVFLIGRVLLIVAALLTEGVTWFVFETPITISKRQVAKFAAIYPYDGGQLSP
jgi:hypothetical protein